MLHGLSLYLVLFLSEALDASNSEIHQVIYEIFIHNLFFLNYFTSKSQDDLGMIQETSLNDFGKLGYYIFFFECHIMLVVFGIDENASDGVKEVAEDLFEISGLVKR